MNTYSVYLPPDCSVEQDISQVKFLVDGKSLLAILAPPIWLLWHRMWWGLVIYFAILAALLMMYFTPFRDAGLFLATIPGLYLMLEGNELIRQRHERNGWQYLGLVQGQKKEDAELRFFESCEMSEPSAMPTATNRSQAIANPATSPSPQSIGLFPLEN